MSSSAHLQLVSRGAEDVYLTGAPRVFLFRAIYHRHTNFALETIEQTFQDRKPSWGERGTVRMSAHGDLLHALMLRVTVPKLSQGYYANGFMHAFLDECTLYIGRQRIHTVYGDWLEAEDELTTRARKRTGYGYAVGKHYTELNGMPDDTYAREGKPTYRTHMGRERDVTFFLPVRFYMRGHEEMALPLVALRHHPVEFEFAFRDFAEVTTQNARTAVGGDDARVDVYALVVYLDEEERARFMDERRVHRYLIDQVRRAVYRPEIPVVDLALPFQNAVKELVWTVERLDAIPFDFGERDAEERVVRAQLWMNHESWVDQPGAYFRTMVPYRHHTRIPTRHVYTYSFALRPEATHPTGALNFSRYTQRTLRLWLSSREAKTSSATAWRVTVFAVSFNRLSFEQGMGSVAFVW